MKDATAVGEICKFVAFLTEGFLYQCIAFVWGKLNTYCLSWNLISREEKERDKKIFEEIVAENFMIV